MPFITPDFIERYSRRAEEIKIDGLKLNLYPEKQLNAIAAYLYDMYMKVREHVPCENLFFTDKKNNLIFKNLLYKFKNFFKENKS